MKKIMLFTVILQSLWTITPAQASLGFLQVFIPKSHPACAKSLPPGHKKFCPSFAAAAQCACTTSGMPESMCKDMKAIHRRMLAIFSTQRKACEFQRDTPIQICHDSWDCYRLGGKDSTGHLCQSSGLACS
jgi:hypothetical protein